MPLPSVSELSNIILLAHGGNYILPLSDLLIYHIHIVLHALNLHPSFILEGPTASV